ncbi:MAG TPA: phosphoenolpyruvate carboxylase, partial [Niabella sp.]|nr:phosphoenolpyruvate carboxylase [Niabella sp.]
KQQKPTPYDEAISLMWYLENIFYQAAGRIISIMKTNLPEVVSADNPIIRMGFWPGGDRDGNPFVNCSTTIQVADALRGAIIKCYYMDVRKLRRRLTFDGVEELLQELEQKLYDNIFIPGHKTSLNVPEIRNTLINIKKIINERHNGLFVSMVQSLLNRLEVFGLHFASLDIRQDSSIHIKLMNEIARLQPEILGADYATQANDEKINRLINIHQKINPDVFENDVLKDAVQIPHAIAAIQQSNGEQGCNRYIISHCTSVLNVIEVFALFKIAGIAEEHINVDIIPLFETIDDLQNAPAVMQELYCMPAYKKHLKRRKNTQTIMLGFSDGTKDGGYLMANWSIYRAKEELTRITRRYGFDVVFFDGRGGPPSRGGGKTHKFYASMGNNISSKEIQLTIQAQTVSANFGVIDSAQFNIEQLLNAGATNLIFKPRQQTMSCKDEELLQELSSYGFDEYIKLKNHPLLPEYLYEVSPLRFYSDTNIGSRPAKRGPSQTSLSLSDLRAIPFAGSWSQLKQNVPGFFGVGSALKKMEYIGKFEEVKKLYNNSLYLKTLLDNCEMAMSKSYFPITMYLKKNEKFGEIWQMIYDEYLLTKEYLFKLSGHSTLMEDYPVDKLSIRMRERIVLPLVTIQQYALNAIRTIDEHNESGTELKDIYGKLVMRCSFGIINAGRNSA